MRPPTDRRLSAMREAIRRRETTPGVNLTRAELVLEAMRQWGEPIRLAELRALLPDIPDTVWVADHGPLSLLLAEGRIARIRHGLYDADPSLVAALTGGRAR